MLSSDSIKLDFNSAIEGGANLTGYSHKVFGHFKLHHACLLGMRKWLNWLNANNMPPLTLSLCCEILNRISAFEVY